MQDFKRSNSECLLVTKNRRTLYKVLVFNQSINSYKVSMNESAKRPNRNI